MKFLRLCLALTLIASLAGPTEGLAKQTPKPTPAAKAKTAAKSKHQKSGKKAEKKKKGAAAPAPTASRKITPVAYSYREAMAAMEAGQASAVQSILARGSDPVMNKVLTAWLMARPGNAYSFDELAGFVVDHPDWPGLKGIMMIAEQKIPAGATNDQLINWFTTYPPLTPTGFDRYIDALMASGQNAKAREMVRARWIDKDLCESELTAFRSRYGSWLRAEDYNARLDRLIWDGKGAGARALYPFVDDGVQAVAEARLALASQAPSADALVARVPSSLQNEAGLLYERVRWRRKNGDDEGAIDLLRRAPEVLGPHGDAWWMERHIIARRLMEKRDYERAYKLVSVNGLSDGFEFVQAEFLAGWLALRAMERPDLAHKHFTNILEEASSPISRARGYYWIGRAYEAADQKRDAQQAYESAAVLNTTFYGQLAIARLYAQPVLRAASEPPLPAPVRNRFFARDAVVATEKLFAMGQTDRAKSFFKAMTDAATQRADFAMLLELAYQLQRPDWAINVAKSANQKNIIVTGPAYPVLSMAMPAEPEAALIHALIRQESLFVSDAGSPVGARGLMQLMPATAKDVARKLGLPYSPDKLTEPAYNVKLGSFFIQKQIDSFDGSYILALAGYNAGPRRVREWVEAFGDPRRKEIDPVDWLELIPIYETRNYVQRIMENLQFYRARLAGGQADLRILQDLKR